MISMSMLHQECSSEFWTIHFVANQFLLVQVLCKDTDSHKCTCVVVRPPFPMMTITSSMMMMMSCLVDPVGAEVANQSNSGLQHSGHGYVGPADVLAVE